MKKSLVVIIALIFVLQGCSMIDAVKDIQKLKFSFDSVSDITVCDINLEGKNKISDFNFGHLATLGAAIASQDFPVSMVVGIEAKNTSPDLMNEDYEAVKIKAFPWKLFLNDKLVATGDITDPVSVPGKGRSKVLKLTASFDLLKVFKGLGYKKLANLLFGIGNGNTGKSTNIKISAQPMVETVLGEYQYPEEITIVQKDIK